MTPHRNLSRRDLLRGTAVASIALSTGSITSSADADKRMVSVATDAIDRVFMDDSQCAARILETD